MLSHIFIILESILKLALLSDLHANLHALEACLLHAKNQGANRFAFLGDLVGYGAYPNEVTQLVMQYHDEGAMVIKGNHDEMAVNPPTVVETYGASTAAWTHDQLNNEQLRFLDQLPLSLQEDECFLVHASADEPHKWRYVTDIRTASNSLSAVTVWPRVRYVFCGHVHQQTLYYKGKGPSLMQFSPHPTVPIPVNKHRSWLATVGSVGQPRDGNNRAMYAILDTDKNQLIFFRVAYDYLSAAQAIRDAGIPEFFANRLETGR